MAASNVLLPDQIHLMLQNEFHPYPFGTVPKRLTDFFQIEPETIIGRTEELERLRTSLCAGHATALVHGIGGIGKTTLARVYVARHWPDYKHIVWLTVAAPQSIDYDPKQAAANEQFLLRDAFLRSAALRERLGVAQKVEAALDNKDLNGAFQILLRRLGELEGCLLVLDNANDRGELQAIRPDLKNLPLHVLVTSRARPQGWTTIEVNELPLSQAIELFKEHYAHPSLATATKAELETLVKTLLYHTLLLELVGKSASPEGANLPFPRLLESVQNHSYHDKHLNEIPVDAGDHADGQNLRRQASVEAYISLIFNQISQLNPEQQDLLKAMTLLLPAQAHDCEELTKCCKLLNIEFHRPRADKLAGQGWLRREPLSEGGVGYSLHPLLLDVAFRELDVTAEWADAVIRFVTNIIHYDEQNPQHDLREKREAQPWAEHLGKLFFEAETDSLSWLFDRLAMLKVTYGFYQSAIKLGERALKIAIKSLSEEFVAIQQSNLANIYRELGDYARARELLEAALAADLNFFGADDPHIAVDQSILGMVYEDLGDYTRAQELLEAALAIDIKNFGVEHPKTAVRQSNLASVYRNLGDYARARDLLEFALASSLKNLGAEHPSIATRYNNLAHVYWSEKNYPAAIEYLIKALRIVERAFGREHPHYETTLESIERVRQEMKHEKERLVD